MKAATKEGCSCVKSRNISIHAAREGGDWLLLILDKFNFISIHAAREGGDYTMLFLYNIMAISIHAAREGGDSGNE